MTDKNSHEENRKPHLKIDADGKWWERDDNDEWVDVTPKPKRTGDPDLDALWAMPASDVERIAENESDPLYEKAMQVQYEAAEPFRQLAKELSRPWRETLGKGVWKFPPLDIDWMSAQKGSALPKSTDPADSETHEASDVEEVEEEADFSQAEPSMAQTQAMWALVTEYRVANEHRERSLDVARQAVSTAQKANDIAQGSNVRAWLALGISSVAAAAAVVSIFV